MKKYDDSLSNRDGLTPLWLSGEIIVIRSTMMVNVSSRTCNSIANHFNFGENIILNNKANEIKESNRLPTTKMMNLHYVLNVKHVQQPNGVNR